MKKFFYPLVILLIIGFLGLLFIFNSRPLIKNQNGDNLAVPEEDLSKFTIPEIQDFSELTNTYKQILGSASANFSITFIDLKTRENISVNGQNIFHGASTTKPIVAAYVLKQVEDGSASLNQKIGQLTLAEHLRLMINISDNESWQQLLDFFGIVKIQNFVENLGLENTNLYDNTSTTNDMAKFLVKIYQEEVFSQENRLMLLSWMQNTEREDRIPAGIPNKEVVFHKAGTYQNGVHDIAIIAHPQNPFVLAIFSDGGSDLSKRPQLLAQIARASWEFADTQN